jgi:predicted enzyme related to lactoylglutathione lyase
MDKNLQALFKKLDAIQLYVPDLEKGTEYYCNHMGLKIIWKTGSAIGLGMDEDVTEIVIQNERKHQEVDIKVENVLEAIEKIQDAGGKILYGPFDIKIGKCAVVKDPWNNEYVILDSTKGTFITDDDGYVIGQNKA